MWTCFEKVESSFREGGGLRCQIASRRSRRSFAPRRFASRSRRAVAADLGIDLSTLRHWIDGQRDREMDAPPGERQEDMATELKRLRGENEVLRQEREILKRATAFFAKERSR